MGKYNINTRSTISSNTISEYEMDKKIILNYQETKMITLDTFCFERKKGRTGTRCQKFND